MSNQYNEPLLDKAVEFLQEYPKLKKRNKELEDKNKELEDENKKLKSFQNEVSRLVHQIDPNQTPKKREREEKESEKEEEEMLPVQKKRKGEEINLKLVMGDLVEATYKGGQRYYSGKIVAVHSDGTYSINYDDGDKDNHVNRREIKKLPIQPDVDSEDEKKDDDEEDSEGENENKNETETETEKEKGTEKEKEKEKEKETEKEMETETSIHSKSKGVEESIKRKPGRPRKQIDTPLRSGVIRKP